MTNPWLSLWLSAANSWAGAARGFWMAEMQRQQAEMMNQMIEQATRFWTQGWLPAPSKKHGDSPR
jgi:hypothetical protein